MAKLITVTSMFPDGKQIIIKDYINDDENMTRDWALDWLWSEFQDYIVNYMDNVSVTFTEEFEKE